MGQLLFYDAAWPPASPPASDGVAFYIGGDTPHVWTAAEVSASKARYRLPIYVRSNPPGPGAAADVAAALAQLKAIGAPAGVLVAWDMETAADAGYISAVSTGITSAGYQIIVYGSQSTVLGNKVPDGLYWGADWTAAVHLAGADVMTQYVSFAGYDLSTARSSLPFWDTQPPGPLPAAYRHVADGTQSLAAVAASRGTTVDHVVAVSDAHMNGKNDALLAAYLKPGGGLLPKGTVYWTTHP
jgi:hypothetical protein